MTANDANSLSLSQNLLIPSELINDQPVTFPKTSTEFEQKFVAIRFASPEKEIKKKLIHDFSKFITYIIDKKVNEIYTALDSDINILTVKIINEMMPEQSTLKSDLIAELKINTEEVRRSQFLSDEFIIETINSIPHDISFNDQVHIYGTKVCGIFSTVQEADKWSEEIGKTVEPHIHTFVCAVGHWCPHEPTGITIKHSKVNATSNNYISHDGTTSDVQLYDVLSGYDDNLSKKNDFNSKDSMSKKSIEAEKDELVKKTKAKIAELKRMRESKK